MLDLGGEDVDPSDDEHVVGAAQYFIHAHHSAPAGALPSAQRRAVPRAIADQGQPLFGQRGEDQLAQLAVA